MPEGPRARTECNTIMRQGQRPLQESNLGTPKGHAFQACAIPLCEVGFAHEHLILYLSLRAYKVFYKNSSGYTGMYDFTGEHTKAVLNEEF